MIVVMLILLAFSGAFVAFILIFGKKINQQEINVFEDIRSPIVLQVLVPRENDKSALAAEQMFASVHGILGDAVKAEDIISFEVASSDEDGIRFYVVYSKTFSKFVEGQMYAQYPMQTLVMLLIILRRMKKMKTLL
jgi:hypothetical protein